MTEIPGDTFVSTESPTASREASGLSGSQGMSTTSTQQGEGMDYVRISREEFEQYKQQEVELNSIRQQLCTLFFERHNELAEAASLRQRLCFSEANIERLMREVAELKVTIQHQKEEGTRKSFLMDPTERWLNREQQQSGLQEGGHVATVSEATVQEKEAVEEHRQHQQPQALLEEENVSTEGEKGATKAVKVHDEESEKMCNFVFLKKVASREGENIYSVMPHSLLTRMAVLADPKHELLRFLFATGGQRCNLPKLGMVSGDFCVAVVDDLFGEGIFPYVQYELKMSCHLGNLVSLGTNWTAQDNTYPLTFLDNQLQEPIDFQFVRHGNSDTDTVVRIGIELHANQLVGRNVCVLSAN